MTLSTPNPKQFAEKRTFAPLLRHRRRLVPANGFIDFRKENKQKCPYHMRLKSRDVFCFAGLWDCWRDRWLTYTIITTARNDVVKPFHHLMPVILREPDLGQWIEGGDITLLRPFPAAEMEAVEINALVNSTAIDLPDCMLPPSSQPSPAEAPLQPSLF